MLPVFLFFLLSPHQSLSLSLSPTLSPTSSFSSQSLSGCVHTAGNTVVSLIQSSKYACVHTRFDCDSERQAISGAERTEFWERVQLMCDRWGRFFNFWLLEIWKNETSSTYELSVLKYLSRVLNKDPAWISAGFEYTVCWWYFSLFFCAKTLGLEVG